MKLINKIFYPLLAILFWYSATGQESGSFTLEGKVLNGQTKGPLFFAEVILVELNKGTTTNEKGEFTLSIPKDGEYTILARYTGFETIKKTISSPVNTQEEVVFYLQPTVHNIPEIVIKSSKSNEFGIGRLKAVEGSAIYACKKNEVILLEDINANLAANNSRQIFAKIAGVNIWESDGAGLQLGIATRGLDPNRTSNFNTRQNGYDISADALGYPESYYSPPMEALKRIEVIRGAASLQYGTQFGGMLNFVLKDGPDENPFEVVTRQSMGSFGYFSSFNSIGGNTKNIKYYTFYNYKAGNGWRPNSEFDLHNGFGSVSWKPSQRFSLTANVTLMNYLANQPGGLTDKQFEENARQSNRERNWFKVNWNLFSLTADYKISQRLNINSRTFSLVASRDALGFLGKINRPDPLEERDLLKDKYLNFGNETRALYKYTFFSNPASFLLGVRAYKGFTQKKQGLGTTGSGPDFTLLNPVEPEHSSFEFPNFNFAAFTENVFHPTERLTIAPGIRWEYIATNSDGYYRQKVTDLAGNILINKMVHEVQKKERSFFLLGLGAGYKLSPELEAYSNFSQNYRAVNFNDIRVVNPNIVVDKNLHDEKGYNMDLGIRGEVNNLIIFDAGVFYLSYMDRIGLVLENDLKQHRKNIGDSRHFGFEGFVEADLLGLLKPVPTRKSIFSWFFNLSLIHAKYVESPNSSVKGKDVELVPPYNVRSGFTYRRNNFSGTIQGSFAGRQYTDATNATFTPDAVNGIIPAYYVLDLSLKYTFGKFGVETGVNNLTNNYYFTRRATGYPGPGIIPSDGRNIYLTLQFMLNKKEGKK